MTPTIPWHQLPAAPRLVILGGSRTGKTTLARQLERTHAVPARHIDELIRGHGLDWSGVSEVASRWLDEPGPWVIEGTRAAHALRKWLRRRPQGDRVAPCDCAIFLRRPMLAQTEGQRRQAEGIGTVWQEVVAQLVARKVRVVGG